MRLLFAMLLCTLVLAACGDDDYNRDLGQTCGCDLSVALDADTD